MNRATRLRRTVRATALIGAALILGITGANLLPGSHPSYPSTGASVTVETGEGRAITRELPPCPTEDSDNCYWDAAHQGNGQGRSFTVIDGEVSYE